MTGYWLLGQGHWCRETGYGWLQVTGYGLRVGEGDGATGSQVARYCLTGLRVNGNGLRVATGYGVTFGYLSQVTGLGVYGLLGTGLRAYG